MNKHRCAYCGIEVSKKDKDHVFPKCLYPKAKSSSKIQRITVPACRECNDGFSDDEAHFRNVMAISGEPNEAVQELWESKIVPSFHKEDGDRRRTDLQKITRSVQTQEGERLMVFPGEDERVLRVVRKIIRGLCDYHGLVSPVSDRRVWAADLRYITHDIGLNLKAVENLLKRFQNDMEYQHREKDIVEYWYEITNDPPIHSAWLIKFFESRTFMGIVSTSEDGFM